MKNQIALKKIVLALAMVGVSIGVAQAATLNGATANATVLTPLSITENTPMNFGSVGSGDNVNPSSVVLTPAGGTSSPDKGYALDGSGLAADFTVNGAADALYTLTMPASITLSDIGGNGGADMTVDSFTYSTGATPNQLDASGVQTFQVGATLHLNANQAASTYQGTYSVTVEY